MDKATRKLGIVRYQKGLYERGDALAEEAVGPLLKAAAPGVNQLAVALQQPGKRANSELLAVAESQAPEMLQTAKQVAMIRSATRRQIAYIYPENATVWSSSLGDADLSPTEVSSVAKDIASGLPVFQPFNAVFNIVSADEFDFYPTFALSQTNVPIPGPLQVGDIVRLVGLYITITNQVIQARAGQPGRLLVEYGPAGMPENQMSFSFKLGEGASDSSFSFIFGAQSGGHAALQTRTASVQGGVPVAGANYPRVRVQGLPTAAPGYQVTARFLRLGDYSIDRFGELLRG
jgi:hypothetical protein